MIEDSVVDFGVGMVCGDLIATTLTAIYLLGRMLYFTLKNK